MAEVREYAADQIVVNLDGIDLQGFAEGDFVTCVRNKDLEVRPGLANMIAKFKRWWRGQQRDARRARMARKKRRGWA